jgi:gluconolactonase
VVVRFDGLGYMTEPDRAGVGPGKVWLIKTDRTRTVLDTGLRFASGVTISPDQSLLYVADSQSHWVYSYQIQPDGTLAHKQRFFWLHCPDDADDSGASSMCCDRDGRLYVATRMGIQICDQAGRVEAILPAPDGRITTVAFGGEAVDTLFAVCADKTYKRKVKVKGALPSEAPVKPSPPRL